MSTSVIEGYPKATLKAAVLTPMEPSSQDRTVAAKADQMANEARSELYNLIMSPQME